MGNQSKISLQRGITALRSFLGEDNAIALLQSAPTRTGEAASFYFPLPIDFTGTARHLRISFPNSFPRGGLNLHIEPSPWLIWPHAMKSGLCLHGLQERPITGSPEFVVADSMSRLAKIVHLSKEGSSKEDRDTEFHSEITSYWSLQQEPSHQNIILLDRPQSASTLFALSDPRINHPSGQETIWLASAPSALKKHYARLTGRSPDIRAAETPGFFLKLKDYPEVRIPQPDHVLPWLEPHLHSDDATQLMTWFEGKGSLIDRWIVLELPGDNGAPFYCLNVRGHGILPNRGARFNLRSARRRPAIAVRHPPARLRTSTLNLLDRSEILSRDPNGAIRELENSRVVCIGVGSLGGGVALQLARSGVGHLTLIDHDKLVAANLGRHVLGTDDLGKNKANALRNRILRDMSTAEVSAYPTFAEVVLHKKPEVFEQADLVVITTADWLSEDTFWRAKSDGSNWAFLQAWSEPHAQVGHALIAPGGSFDARHLFTENGDFRHKFTEWPTGRGRIALPACGESFIPGSSMGMMNIVSMVAQAALNTLTGHINESTWVSSINRPQDLSGLNGKYVGPPLPSGMRQAQLERGWPEQT